MPIKRLARTEERPTRLGEVGALSLPLLFSLLAVVTAGFGIWGVMRHWRHVMELQVRLDRCVGGAAIDALRTQKRIEAENLVMKGLRVGITASTILDPPAAVALREALVAAESVQDLELGRWKLKRLAWLARKGCGQETWLWTSAPPLPELAWTRPPPDQWGPRPLHWDGGTRPLRFELLRRPRGSAAEVTIERSTAGEIIDEHWWKAAWVPPESKSPWDRLRGTLGPSVD